MISAGTFGISIGALTVPWWTARETAALIIVILTLLFFRAFRERYLLTWGAGWLAYGAYLWFSGPSGTSALHLTARPAAALVKADFVLAIAMFAAAALMSVQARRALIVGAAMLPFYIPDSRNLSLGLEIACRLLAAGAFVQLLHYRRGRIGISPFLFGTGILTLNLNWPRLTTHIPSEGY